MAQIRTPPIKATRQFPKKRTSRKKGYYGSEWNTDLGYESDIYERPVVTKPAPKPPKRTLPRPHHHQLPSPPLHGLGQFEKPTGIVQRPPHGRIPAVCWHDGCNRICKSEHGMVSTAMWCPPRWPQSPEHLQEDIEVIPPKPHPRLPPRQRPRFPRPGHQRPSWIPRDMTCWEMQSRGFNVSCLPRRPLPRTRIDRRRLKGPVRLPVKRRITTMAGKFGNSESVWRI